MDIDRQRIAAVRALEALGFNYQNGTWMPAVSTLPPAPMLSAEADAMHAMLVRRADALSGFLESAREDAELKAIADVVEAYETKRWPEGKERGGKG
jgi:hypothetical protein